MLNRPGGTTGTAGSNYSVHFKLNTDDVSNYEISWKLDLFDYSVRFNDRVFFVEIESMQTTIFDPSISNLFFSDNAADADVMGFEGDVTWVPASIEGLTLNAAFSFLDPEITIALTPTSCLRKGS